MRGPLVLYEDAAARALEPFALTRPATELGAGALLVRDRWAATMPGRVLARVGAAHLAGFDEPGTPVTAQGLIAAGTIVANARFAPSLVQPVPDDAAIGAWMADGRVAAVRLTAALDAAALADGTMTLDALVRAGTATTTLGGWWIEQAWDLVRHLGPMLAEDIPVLGAALETQDADRGDAVRVLGSHPVFIEAGARVEPFVVLDAQPGPLLVRCGAHIQAFSRLVGPCVVGADSTVHGGRVANSAIGAQCRVHGDVSTSLFFGRSNKAHDGFVGHSVIGCWANLGAGTTTSNLKNSYGTVQMWTPSGVRDSGMQFLGALIGDHAKLAIGTMLMTGTLIGAGASVFDDAGRDRVVPPFAWGGDAAAVYALDKFLDVAAHVMSRRGVTMSDAMRRALSDAHAGRWSA